MELKTPWDVTNDAINTIIGRVRAWKPESFFNLAAFKAFTLFLSLLLIVAAFDFCMS